MASFAQELGSLVLLYLGSIKGETLSFNTPPDEEGWKAMPWKWIVVTENSEQGLTFTNPYHHKYDQRLEYTVGETPHLRTWVNE